MHPTILVTGGCRSGKSSHALTLANDLPGNKKLFLATCVPHDDEMRQRVSRHQAERADNWITIEESVALTETIWKQGPAADAILIDCLTLWVSNMMAASKNDQDISDCIAALCKVVASPPCPLIFVTNEVGAGIVPENPLARRFRDLTGWTNQKVAATCRQVVWMVSGIAVTVKSPGASAHTGGM